MQLGYAKSKIIVRQQDYRTMVFRVVQTAGTNVLTVMGGLKETIRNLNENTLRHRGLELQQAL